MKILKGLFCSKKQENSITDHRQSKRYDIMLKLNYFEPVSQCHGESFTKNISKRGLRFPVNSKLAKGSILEMQVEDPNADRLLSFEGEVVWSGELVGSDDIDSTRYEIGVNLLKNRLF